MSDKPLAGLRVAVTSSRRASELAHLIEAMGGIPYVAPTVGIEASSSDFVAEEVRRYISLARDQGIDLAIFMTGPGTEAVIDASKSIKVEEELLGNLRSLQRIVARSTKPRAVLTKYGIIQNVVLPEEATFEGISLLLKGKDLKGKRIAIFWHGDRSHFLIENLEKKGAHVFEFKSYLYSKKLNADGSKLLKIAGFQKVIPPEEENVERLIQDIVARKIDVITFTSPPSISNLFEKARSVSLDNQLAQSMKRMIIVSIGPSTSQRLRECGFERNVEPKIYKMGKMVEALSDYVKKSQ